MAAQTTERMMTVGSMVMLVPVVLITSFLSGIFGMAGGLILLWFLFLIVPASMAIAVHGIIQLVSNGSRALLSRQFLDYKVLARVTAGLLLATFLLLSVYYSPNAAIASIVIGLLPLLLWIPSSTFALDAARPHHAFACGLIAGGLTITVGTSGPLIDLFFIRTRLDRRTIIATKAAIQVVAHFAKVMFYLNAAMSLDARGWTAVLICIPVAVSGAWLGKIILHRMSDFQFRSWTRILVTGIGFVYLIQGGAALVGA